MNEYNMWMIVTYVCLEGSKPRIIPDSTGVPGDNIKLHSAIEAEGDSEHFYLSQFPIKASW